MKIANWKWVAVPFAALGVASPMLSSCSAVNSMANAAGVESPDCSGEFESGNFADLKADAKIKGFLEASFKFDAAVDAMEVDLIASCAELGKAIGVADGELKAEANGGEGAKKVCGAVSAKIEGMLKANAKGQLQIDVKEPVCKADIEALTKCFGECGAAITPGEFKASCQGGELSGKCDGKCQGTCKVEAAADCKGSCNAQCTGKCEANFSGKCGGKCEGKCNGKNTTGKCDGTCEGKCDAKAEGTCGGSCEGGCSGTCEMKGSAECKGECSGGCDVDYKAPKCSGDFKPPKVSVDCQASCAAKTAQEVKCDPPQVLISVKGEANTDIQKLVSALQVSLPKIIKIQLGSAKTVGKIGTQLAGELEGAAKAASSAGIKAAACMTMAVDATAKATASVKVNVEASASVSGSASGKAGG